VFFRVGDPGGLALSLGGPALSLGGLRAFLPVSVKSPSTVSALEKSNEFEACPNRSPEVSEPPGLGGPSLSPLAPAILIEGGIEVGRSLAEGGGCSSVGAEGAGVRVRSTGETEPSIAFFCRDEAGKQVQKGNQSRGPSSSERCL
jgi:hypothetical protein